MPLTDHQIELLLDSGKLGIEPMKDRRRQIQPCSVDLRLSNIFYTHAPEMKMLPPTARPYMRLDHDASAFMRRVEATQDAIVIEPGEFVLGATVERVRLDAWHVGTVMGRSSVGRKGLFIENAGLIDPGYDGHITLELFNASPVPIAIPLDAYICQLVIDRLAEACERPYGSDRGSKYIGEHATGAVPSRGETSETTKEGE